MQLSAIYLMLKSIFTGVTRLLLYCVTRYRSILSFPRSILSFKSLDLTSIFMNNGCVSESTGRVPRATAKPSYYEPHNIAHNQHNIPWHKTSSVVCGVVGFSVSGTCSVEFPCFSGSFAARFPVFIALHAPDSSVVGHFPRSYVCRCCYSAGPYSQCCTASSRSRCCRARIR